MRHLQLLYSLPPALLQDVYKRQEMGYSTGLHREALIATGVVLFVFILIINLLFSIIKRKERKA